jgi:tetratricopeptide (TPR) repeat protein
MDELFARPRSRASRWRWLVGAGIVVGSVGGPVIGHCLRNGESDCEHETQRGDRARAARLCLDSYERSGNERNLLLAAKSYMYLGELDQADDLARRILDRRPAGAPGGDARDIRSYVAMRRGLLDDARQYALAARTAHRAVHDVRGLVSDAVLLSETAWKAGDFTAAAAAASEAVTLSLSPAVEEAHLKVVAHLAQADALLSLGDENGAAAAAMRAVQLSKEPCDEAWTRLRRGIQLMQRGWREVALSVLGDAGAANQRCGSRDVSLQILMNQAWLLRARDPLRAIAMLDEIERLDGEWAEALLLRGYVAADRGALAEAGGYFARAATLEPSDADWPWEISLSRAELSELQGGLSGNALAETHYRAATAQVAAVRGNARGRAAYFVSSHRDPYDGLVALLARDRRWEAALAVILELDASDMLRATADDITARHNPVSAPRPDPATAPFSPDEVLSAWRSRELVIVIAPAPRRIGAGGERAYRIRIANGRLSGEDIGEASTARQWADALYADPGDRVAARALGRMIVPRDPSGQPLHVLAIGAMGKVPLAALRDEDGSLIVRHRPLVRVLGLGARTQERLGTRPPVVIADPRGDLPNAAEEGALVAAAVGSTARVVGSGRPAPATRDELWAAHDATLLHVAAHILETGHGRALQLADGEIAPAEIVQRGLAPGFAVLAGCGSVAAMDEEGWGSVAAALLESGTRIVIATDRSVGDDASLVVMRAFYQQPDWSSDPPRALARVQQALDARSGDSSDAATQARSWAAFVVLGRPPSIRPR